MPTSCVILQVITYKMSRQGAVWKLDTSSVLPHPAATVACLGHKTLFLVT